MGEQAIRLAIVGGGRGQLLVPFVAQRPKDVRLHAFCDPDPEVRGRWQQTHPELRVYAAFDQLVADDDVDAVYVASPVAYHAAQSSAALSHGKHVLCEVPAITTLEEGWAVLAAARASDRVFMMSENYCYTRANMLVGRMVEEGLFGELTRAEGAYIHDCRALLHRPDGELTWRGRIHRDWNNASYPTHAIGPPAQWLGINRGSHRFVRLSACASRVVSLPRHFAGRFGAEHPAAATGYWRHGDSQEVLLTTNRGAVVHVRVDWTSARPHNTIHNGLQGATGAYLAPRHEAEPPLVWFDPATSRVTVPTGSGGPLSAGGWRSLWDYAPAFEHPRWRAFGDKAAELDHRAWDGFVLDDFLAAVRGDAPPAIDVVDAVTWSALIPLSERSVALGGATVDFPDFSAPAAGSDG